MIYALKWFYGQNSQGVSMGKKNHAKSQKKKLTKKEKKQLNHLKLVKGKKDNGSPDDISHRPDHKKSA